MKQSKLKIGQGVYDNIFVVSFYSIVDEINQHILFKYLQSRYVGYYEQLKNNPTFATPETKLLLNKMRIEGRDHCITLLCDMMIGIFSNL